MFPQFSGMSLSRYVTWSAPLAGIQSAHVFQTSEGWWCHPAIRESPAGLAGYPGTARDANFRPAPCQGNRGVAQPGRVLRSGRRSRRFESSHPDHFNGRSNVNAPDIIPAFSHPGPIMVKWLLLVLILLIVYLAVKSARRAARSKARTNLSVERMVACGRCGVNLPESEAISLEGRFYCSKDHSVADSS